MKLKKDSRMPPRLSRNPSFNYQYDHAVDLTQDLANNMPVYPGDPVPTFHRTATIAANGVNLSQLDLGSHTGTHVDAPRHFVERGTTLDRIPVSDFIGEAVVLDLSFKPEGSGITALDLKKTLALVDYRPGDAILCYTGCSAKWGDPKVNSNFTYLTPRAAEYIVSKKARAFGIDFLSVEKFHSKTHATHKELLSHGIYIVESLNRKLRDFAGERILFIALPIKFKDGDGAPCRALAVPIKVA